MTMTATPNVLAELLSGEAGVDRYMADPIIGALASDIPADFDIDAAVTDPGFFNTVPMVYILSGGEPDVDGTTVADAVEALRRLVHRNHGRA